MLNRILSDSFTYTLPTVVSALLSFAVLPIYTRLISPSDYGALDLIIIMATLINKVIVLEITQGLGRFYADEHNVRKKINYCASAFWFTLFVFLSFTLGALYFRSSLYIIVFGHSDLLEEYTVGVLYITLYGIFYFILNQLRWELRAFQYALISIVVALSSAILATLFAYVFGLGLFGILLGMTIGLSLGILLGLFQLRESLAFSVKVHQLVEMLKFSFPLVFATAAIWIGSFADRIMIRTYLGIADVGVYAIGFKISSIVFIFMVGIGAALTPLILKHYKEPDTPTTLATAFRFFVVLAIMLVAFLASFSDELVQLLSTEEFYSSAELVLFLTPSIILAQMYIFAPGPMLEKKTNYILIITASGALLNIVFNYCFIQFWGIKGAASATLLSSLITFFLHMSVSQKLYPVPHNWYHLCLNGSLAIIFIIGFEIVSSALPNGTFSIIIYNLIFILFLFFFLVVVGFLQPNEIRKMLDGLYKYKKL